MLKKLCRVITAKVCKDFRRESANTFAPKVCKDFQNHEGAKVFADSRRKSLQTLAVITPEFREKVRI